MSLQVITDNFSRSRLEVIVPAEIRCQGQSDEYRVAYFDTGSQVCSLLFNKYEREIISSHGFSKNQISIWSYPSMKKITELTGHTNRVLYTSMSPDHSTLVSGSPDETLRFWKINNIEKINEYEVNKHRSSYKRSSRNGYKYYIWSSY